MPNPADASSDVWLNGVCAPLHLVAGTSTPTQYTLSPQPFKIALDSPTDYVAALVLPLALAIAAGVFTVMSNRQQIKASTANFRHTWQLDLRNAMVSYIGAAQHLLIRTRSTPSFPQSEQAEAVRTQLFTAQNTVILMLDPDKQYANDLKAKMLEVNNAIFGDPPDTYASVGAMNQVIFLSQQALENAWRDIRRDLHHKKPKR